MQTWLGSPTRMRPPGAGAAATAVDDEVAGLAAASSFTLPHAPAAIEQDTNNAPRCAHALLILDGAAPAACQLIRRGCERRPTSTNMMLWRRRRDAWAAS
jgi:hypothetical protein